jgi:hypothetical protein
MNDIAEAFNRLDALLAAAEAAGPAMELLLATGKAARHHRDDNVSPVADQWNDRALGAEVVA